jgi:hypothetical protein
LKDKNAEVSTDWFLAFFDLADGVLLNATLYNSSGIYNIHVIPRFQALKNFFQKHSQSLPNGRFVATMNDSWSSTYFNHPVLVFAASAEVLKSKQVVLILTTRQWMVIGPKYLSMWTMVLLSIPGKQDINERLDDGSPFIGALQQQFPAPVGPSWSAISCFD